MKTRAKEERGGGGGGVYAGLGEEDALKTEASGGDTRKNRTT